MVVVVVLFLLLLSISKSLPQFVVSIQDLKYNG